MTGLAATSIICSSSFGTSNTFSGLPSRIVEADAANGVTGSDPLINI